MEIEFMLGFLSFIVYSFGHAETDLSKKFNWIFTKLEF